MTAPHEGSLEHHGVKGMHWGVKKAAPLPFHKDYSKRLIREDALLVGGKGVRKINQRLHNGEDHQSARRAELKSALKKQLAISGAALVVHILVNHGDDLASHAKSRHRDFVDLTTKRAAENRDKARNPDPVEPKVVKPNRKGVHKVHSF